MAGVGALLANSRATRSIAKHRAVADGNTLVRTILISDEMAHFDAFLAFAYRRCGPIPIVETHAVTGAPATADKVVTLKESAAWVFLHLSRQMWIGIIIGAAVLVASIVIAAILGLGQATGSASEGPAQKAPSESGHVFHFEDPMSDQ